MSSRARRRPSFASCCRRVGRIFTNANSAAPKNAFARTITSVSRRAIVGLIGGPQDRTARERRPVLVIFAEMQGLPFLRGVLFASALSAALALGGAAAAADGLMSPVCG